ncbi:MAG: hypothetical protein AAGF59_03590 [Pseudomonadota bacterium]
MAQIMLYAGLGFFVAMLVGLLISPILRQRTVRLTERRLRAELPQTLEEIRGERDGLRAEYALRTRQLEIKLEKQEEEALDRKMLLERRNEEIYALKTERRQKHDIISELGDDLDNQRDLSRAKDEELSRAKSRVRDLTTRLDRRSKELERAEARSAELEALSENQRGELAQVRAALRNAESYGYAPTGANEPVAAAVSANAPIASVAAETPASDLDRMDGDRVEPSLPPQPVTNTPEPAKPDTQAVDALELRIAELTAANLAADLRATNAEDQLAAVEGQVETLESRLAELQESGGSDDRAVKAANAEKAKLEGTVRTMRADLADKDQRIAELEAAAGTAQPVSPAPVGDPAVDDADRLEREAEKAAFDAEVTRLTMALEAAKAETETRLAAAAATETDARRALENSLTKAEEERDAARTEAADLKRELESARATTSSSGSNGDYDQLRDSLSNLAADVTHMVRALEGEGSTIDDILTKANGSGAAASVDGGSLAERIQSLRERAIVRSPAKSD